MSDEYAVATIKPGELMQRASAVAGAVKKIIKQATMTIKGRAYIKVEGWQAIANAFGFVAASRDVTKVYDDASGEFLGYRAVGEVRRERDGMVIAVGEGFVGIDEPMWFGGEQEKWNEPARQMETKTLPKRADYAIRAMAQTRAVSRACRGAFAFVLVLIDKNLDTTPAEEVGEYEPNDTPMITPEASEKPASARVVNGDWQTTICTFGKTNGPLYGRPLGQLTPANLNFLYNKFVKSGQKVQKRDEAMAEALRVWHSKAIPSNENQTD